MAKFYLGQLLSTPGAISAASASGDNLSTNSLGTLQATGGRSMPTTIVRTVGR